jgi:hypothetical protein
VHGGPVWNRIPPIANLVIGLHFRWGLSYLSPKVPEIQEICERASAAIAPLKPADKSVDYFYGKRTWAGQKLPPYYLVYFLLVDLLRFRHGGHQEKVDWSIPVEIDGGVAIVEHRKLGLGVFVPEAPKPDYSLGPASPESEAMAQRIVRLIEKGVKVSTPYFNHLASVAVDHSQLNVVNNGVWLYERFEFLRNEFRKKLRDAAERKTEKNTVENRRPDGSLHFTETTYPAFQLRQEAEWIGIAAVEAFFGWTEHVLIHIAILEGKIKMGDAVDKLARAEWADKVKMALDIGDPSIKGHYDKLLFVRTQIRNYMAHGAFGKGGEAFHFHSKAGAIPVRLTEKTGKGRFSLLIEKPFDEGEALQTADAFIAALWSGSRAPARLYLQDSYLPVVLTYAADGTYQTAMTSEETMAHFIEGLQNLFAQSADMDW